MRSETVNERDESRLTTADIAGGRSPESREAQRDITQEGQDGPSVTEEASMAPLLPEDEISTRRERWQSIQANFVDEPREAVREADTLVADVIQKLAESFATQRASLENQWSRGSDVSTEELRRALQQYRSFFERLLAA
jgi:molecular chaperone GrpE (heat shock protein)